MLVNAVGATAGGPILNYLATAETARGEIVASGAEQPSFRNTRVCSRGPCTWAEAADAVSNQRGGERRVHEWPEKFER